MVYTYTAPPKSPPQWRANPYHDDKGKFTTGPGGGGWQRLDADALDRERLADIERVRPLSSDDRAKVLAFLGPNPVHAELRKEGMRIRDLSTNGLARDDLDAVAKAVDVLQKTNPTTSQDIDVTINAERVFPVLESGSYVGGQTTAGTARIMLNERAWRDTNRTDLMPAVQMAPRSLGILAHEWGHVIDTGNPTSQGLLWISHFADMTDYGNTSPREGYAEAFSEYFLSMGRTTNPAAVDYAREFRWGHP